MVSVGDVLQCVLSDSKLRFHINFVHSIQQGRYYTMSHLYHNFDSMSVENGYRRSKKISE